MIKLRQEHLAVIIRCGEAEYPYECCGILTGNLAEDKAKIVGNILPISNARAESDKHNRFLITPEEMLRGEMFARKHQQDVLGFYHSHPDHPSAPSAYDLEHAWPFYSYVIVSVVQGKAESITSWELKNDRSEFIEESISKENDICL